jgi:twitching motility protein PilJ
MQNPIWNLMIRVCSLAGGVLLLIGIGLLAAFRFGFVEDSFAGLLTAFLGAGLTLYALVAVNMAHFRLKHEIAEAADIAHRLSAGETYDGPADTELLDSLRNVSFYFEEKAEDTRKIVNGEPTSEIRVRSDMDVLGLAFQDMSEALGTVVQSQESRVRLHQSVMKLLDEVSEVSSGDLTVQAEVGTEITGPIADAFNSMTRNLRSLIRQIRDVGQQVGTSATAISDTTDQLEKGSVAQASQISRTKDSISGMASLLHEVAENASLSAQVAANSLDCARSGTQAARDNIDAMKSIRQQVQETAKRIKRLGERSQEISQIVGLIDDLSDRTSLLALNASLQASAAGKPGDGFAVVAEEVERLAERSVRLTQQIAEVTRTINAETQDVVASMEETIREVSVGSALADKAGHSLIEIEEISAQLDELLRSISESAKFQVKSAEDISNAMSSISEVTELVRTGSERAAGSVRTLVQLAYDLRSSISPFKLPDDVIPNRPRQPESGQFLN